MASDRLTRQALYGGGVLPLEGRIPVTRRTNLPFVATIPGLAAWWDASQLTIADGASITSFPTGANAGLASNPLVAGNALHGESWPSPSAGPVMHRNFFGPGLHAACNGRDSFSQWLQATNPSFANASEISCAITYQTQNLGTGHGSGVVTNGTGAYPPVSFAACGNWTIAAPFGAGVAGTYDTRLGWESGSGSGTEMGALATPAYGVFTVFFDVSNVLSRRRWFHAAQTNSSTTGPFGTQSHFAIMIGFEPYGAGSLNFAELAFYHGILSDANRNSVMTYMRQKWGST